MLSIFIILKVKKYLFYGFVIVCLFTLFSFNLTAFQKSSQQTNISSRDTKITSLSYSIADSPPQQPTSLYSVSKEILSAKSPVSVAPSSVTQEEIVLRERQVKIAEEDERYVESKFQAGVAGLKEKRIAEYFVLSNKIKLLQAKELLRLKQQQKKSKNSLAKIHSSAEIADTIILVKTSRSVVDTRLTCH